MDRLILPESKIFTDFINANSMVHTDLRYNVGDRQFVLDVVQYPEVQEDEEEIRRLLLIQAGKESSAEHFWDVLSETDGNYIVPIKHNSGVEEIAIYEIPVSVRPLIAETKKFKNEAQNRMDNARIASSLGVMVRKFADITKLYIPPEVVESRAAIIDFVDEETQPVLLVPPIVYEMSDMPAEQYYSSLFDYDLSFKVPFIKALSEDK
jgi:hypothetical protein